MSRFNLLTDTWIPVAPGPGKGPPILVGIDDLLRQAHRLGDIECDSSSGTVAIIRLLLAILYRSGLGANFGEYKSLWKAGQFPMDRIECYLTPLRERFELFGERPFYQIAGLNIAKRTPASKLASELSTGQQERLYAWMQARQMSEMDPATAARFLVEIQSFALGGGNSANPIVSGNALTRPNFEDGPVARGLSVWLSGHNLFETLALNLTPYQAPPDDLPAWEQADPLALLDAPSRGRIDRFTWQSRMILLNPPADDGDPLELPQDKEPSVNASVKEMLFTQGRRGDKDMIASRDPMAVYYTADAKKGTTFLRLNPNKATWRQLDTMMALDAKTMEGTPVFEHTAQLVRQKLLDPERRFALNVAGLVTNQASISMVRHDRLTLPAAILADKELQAITSRALEEAEGVASEMGRRMYLVGKAFLPPFDNPSADDVRSLIEAVDPRRAYWPRLEPPFEHFVAALPKDREGALKAWRQAVKTEARRAMEEACSQLGESARAIRATAKTSFNFLVDRDEVAAALARAKARKKGAKK